MRESVSRFVFLLMCLCSNTLSFPKSFWYPLICLDTLKWTQIALTVLLCYLITVERARCTRTHTHDTSFLSLSLSQHFLFYRNEVFARSANKTDTWIRCSICFSSDWYGAALEKWWEIVRSWFNNAHATSAISFSPSVSIFSNGLLGGSYFWVQF